MLPLPMTGRHYAMLVVDDKSPSRKRPCCISIGAAPAVRSLCLARTYVPVIEAFWKYNGVAEGLRVWPWSGWYRGIWDWGCPRQCESDCCSTQTRANSR